MRVFDGSMPIRSMPIRSDSIRSVDPFGVTTCEIPGDGVAV